MNRKLQKCVIGINFVYNQLNDIYLLNGINWGFNASICPSCLLWCFCFVNGC